MSATTLATPLPAKDGYTWTIASLIGRAMQEAEAAYGARDAGYFFAGYEFVDGVPQLWFPGNANVVVMQLSIEAQENLSRAAFQLSHEVIHLLNPVRAGLANVLEEGLATYFQGIFAPEFGNRWISDVPSYIDAQTAVKRLLDMDPQAISRLRAEEPCLSKISEDMIRRLCPGVDFGLATALTARFKR